MPISITITADTPAELSGWLDVLAGPAVTIDGPFTVDADGTVTGVVKAERQVGMVKELAAAYGASATTELAVANGGSDTTPAAETLAHLTQNTSAEPAAAPTEAKVDKPKRTRAAKTEPTIPPTAEAYEAALGEPTAVVSAATSDAGEKSEGSTAGTDTSGATTSTSSIATTGASPSDTTDLAVVRTRVQNKLRELGTIAGGGRGSVTEVLNEINGGNIGAMTCPAENLPRLEAAVDARLAALKGAA